MDFHPARFLQRTSCAEKNEDRSAPAEGHGVVEQHADDGSGSGSGNETAPERPALLILNQPVPAWDVFERLWRCCGYRLCADGGANRLFDTFADGGGGGGGGGRRGEFIPDSIHGDLDSLRDDVRAYYQSKGVAISRDPDQYSTDFGKAIKKIAAATEAKRDVDEKNSNNNNDEKDESSANNSKNIDTNGDAVNSTTTPEIIILGTLAGRVDQGLGLLYEMYRESNKPMAPHLWLFSESSASWILPPGRHRIYTPIQRGQDGQGQKAESRGSRKSKGTTHDDSAGAGFFTKMIGILPAFGPAVISTQGLEWDVETWATSVGGQVSTSNHVVGDCVVVETDAKVLFTIERAEVLP